MLLLSLFVGVVIFTAGGTALSVNTTSSTTTSHTTTSPTTTTPPTAATTTPHTTTTTHTTTTKTITNMTTPFQMVVTGGSGPLLPLPVTTASPHPETSTKTTSHSYPVVAGLRALVRSSVELDMNQANSILQQFLAHLPSYYNVTARITSIKKV